MLLVHPNDHDTSPPLGLRILEPPAIALGVDMGRNDGRSVFDDPPAEKSSAAAVCPRPPMTIDTTESTPQRIEEGRPCSVMGSLYRIAQRGFKPSFAVEKGTREPGSHSLDSRASSVSHDVYLAWTARAAAPQPVERRESGRLAESRDCLDPRPSASMPQWLASRYAGYRIATL
jgi:hypothetical protein